MKILEKAFTEKERLNQERDKEFQAKAAAIALEFTKLKEVHQKEVEQFEANLEESQQQSAKGARVLSLFLLSFYIR